jgi:hypothetical protein
MKQASKIIISAVCALALIGCSNSSDSQKKDASATTIAKKPNDDTIKSAFEVETALRVAAKAAAPNGAKTVTTLTSSFILNLAAEKQLPLGITITGEDQNGEAVTVWDGDKQTASAEDLAIKQTQLQVEGNGTKVCMRLAQDANLFITDVPAMKEQLTQYPKASGITKITTSGDDACKWSATSK